MDSSKYFYRILVYTRQEEKVAVVGRDDQEKTIPLEAWLGVVVSLADGQHTIGELVEYLGGRYQDEPPEELKRTIESVIDRLVESEVIRLSDEPVRLSYHLTVPQEEQIPEMARQSMEKDGHTLQ